MPAGFYLSPRRKATAAEEAGKASLFA